MVERTVQEQFVREAPEIEAYKIGLLEAGKAIADQPINLPDQTVAGFDPAEQSVYDYLQNMQGGIGGYAPYAQTGRGTLQMGLGTLGRAQDQLGRAEAQTLLGAGQFGGGPGYTAGQFGGGPGYGAAGFDPASASQYMNPYEDTVVQQALSDIQRQGDIAQTQADAQAVGAGAFGGSRQGIQRAEMGRNLLDTQARTAAGLRSSGYQQAMAQAQQAFMDQQRRAQAEAQFRTQSGQQAFEDQQRRAQAQAQFGTQSQQQAFEAAKQRQMGIGQGIASLGGQMAGIGTQQAGIGGQQLGAAQQMQSTKLRDLGLLQQMGQQSRGIAQAQSEADYQNQLKQLYEPYGRISWLGDIYKGAPSSQSVLGSTLAPSPPSPSMFQQIAGLGTGLLGTAAAAKSIGGLF